MGGAGSASETQAEGMMERSRRGHPSHRRPTFMTDERGPRSRRLTLPRDRFKAAVVSTGARSDSKIDKFIPTLFSVFQPIH